MTFKVRDIISTTAFATRRSQKIYTIHELLERSFRGVNLISIRKLTRAALPRLNWTRALLLFFFFLSSPPAPRSSFVPWDSRQFWFALITRSLTRRERGWRRRRGLAEFPCAATMPIIAAPFPVNENEGVKKSREVKALPPGIVAALATYRDHFSFYISLLPSLSPLPVLYEYFCFEYFFGDGALPPRVSSSCENDREIKLRNNVERIKFSISRGVIRFRYFYFTFSLQLVEILKRWYYWIERNYREISFLRSFDIKWAIIYEYMKIGTFRLPLFPNILRGRIL